MDGLTATLAEWTNHLMVWVGFGAIVGLLSKAVLPGKDPGGTFATVFIGVFGSIIGAATLFFFSGQRVEPISIVGFLAAVGGASLLLVTYRLLNGRQGWKSAWRGRRAGRRRIVVEEK
jgi:uncharacterized membrane protein YeaQ/YmgE (transglycosylase-associated protein family)